MELYYCPSCASPILMKDAKYCELCGLELIPIRKAMEKLHARGTTITEQMDRLIAPKINKEDTEEEITAKIIEFTDGNYAEKALQLFEGKGVEKNPDFAMKCLKLGVRLGDTNAELLTAKVEMEGLYNQNKDPKHSQELLLKLAQNGNIEAQFLLGELLHDPSWYKKAAQQGHVESMYKIGRYYTNKCYKNSADYKSAEQWLKDAANRGHYGAAYELANLYYENQRQFNQDAAYHAFQYATNAAEHDYKKAQLLLSHFYRYGYGCKTDSELCEYWRDKSYDTL